MISRAAFFSPPAPTELAYEDGTNTMTEKDLTELERALIGQYQRDFPVSARPYQAMAERLGVSEADVLAALERLQAGGVVSRVGPVFRPGGIGCSTLAAMAVPEDQLEAVAEMVSGFDAVNHNYQRTHRLNLWFVVTAADEDGVLRVIREIEERTGLRVLDLPMVEDYHLDLGFEVQWTSQTPTAA